MDKKHVLIIGGGPAGMMAAITSRAEGYSVTLLEKNRALGKKLLLTGNGRCNLTNTSGLDAFLEKFGKNGVFLRDAFKFFFNTELIGFFEERGLNCKTEEQGKVFPARDKAESVLRVLVKELINSNVNILYDADAASILTDQGRVNGARLRNGKTILSGRVILASGGASYPSTGSSGDGFKMAALTGHTITPLRPGLVPLTVKENYPGLLMGLSLRNAGIKISTGKRVFPTRTGDIMFTSNGLSGPLALSISGAAADLLAEGKSVNLSIDQFPGMSAETIVSMLTDIFSSNPSKNVKNSLKNFIPQRLGDLFLEIARVDKNKTANQVTKKERFTLASLCKDFRLAVSGTAPVEEAMITRGGVSLKEVNPRTMASRLVKGLYFAGEILDIDGDTGGFNLQAAFSTGRLAGMLKE
ncbi:MAG: NAD(P)/FAD-dependent oxidoreductase [Candidatus Omnitrophota bacterium]